MHLAVERGIKVQVLAEPGVGGTDRKLVRETVVADLRALPLLHEVLQSRGDGLAVVRGVEVLRDHGHAPGHDVERRAGGAEGGVIVVGEAVHRLARPVPVAGEHARVGGGDFAERLQDALVAELLGHDRRHRGFGIVEPEPAPQPALGRLLEDDATSLLRTGNGRCADQRHAGTPQEAPVHQLVPETGRKVVQKVEPMSFTSASGVSVQAALS